MYKVIYGDFIINAIGIYVIIFCLVIFPDLINIFLIMITLN